MAKVLICIACIVFAAPAMADELQELNNTRNQLNVLIIKAQAQYEMNQEIVLEAMQRGVKLDETINQLRDQFSKITRDMRKLEAVTEEKAD